MNNLAVAGLHVGAGFGKYPVDVEITHLAAVNADLDTHNMGRRIAPRERDDDFIDGLISEALGIVYRRTDRFLCGIDIDDRAGAQPLGSVMPHSTDANRAAAVNSRDEALDLCRTDVECCDDSAASYGHPSYPLGYSDPTNLALTSSCPCSWNALAPVRATGRSTGLATASR